MFSLCNEEISEYYVLEFTLDCEGESRCVDPLAICLASNIEIGLVLSPLFCPSVTTRSTDINLTIKFKNVF